MCCRTRTGAAAGGGGGGGGGGGATRNVMSCCFGNASVKISGSRTRTPTSNACNTNEIAVVAPRLVLSLPPDSIRLSSNIGFSLQQTPRILRHQPAHLCSRKNWILLSKAPEFPAPRLPPSGPVSGSKRSL